MAGLQLDAGRLEQAKTAALKAVEKARDADDRPREVEARVRLAQVHGATNDWSAAAEVLDEAVGLIRQVARDEPAEQVRLLLIAAEADDRAKLKDRASSETRSREAKSRRSPASPISSSSSKRRGSGAATNRFPTRPSHRSNSTRATGPVRRSRASDSAKPEVQPRVIDPSTAATWLHDGQSTLPLPHIAK